MRKQKESPTYVNDNIHHALLNEVCDTANTDKGLASVVRLQAQTYVAHYIYEYDRHKKDLEYLTTKRKEKKGGSDYQFGHSQLLTLTV